MVDRYPSRFQRFWGPGGLVSTIEDQGERFDSMVNVEHLESHFGVYLVLDGTQKPAGVPQGLRPGDGLKSTVLCRCLRTAGQGTVVCDTRCVW